MSVESCEECNLGQQLTSHYKAVQLHCIFCVLALRVVGVSIPGEGEKDERQCPYSMFMRQAGRERERERERGGEKERGSSECECVCV